MTTGDEGKAMYACKVCGNVPDDDGILSHGRGCYVISEDGGGEEFVEMKEQDGKVELPELPGNITLMPVIQDMYSVLINKQPEGRIDLQSVEDGTWIATLINSVYHPTHGVLALIKELKAENKRLRSIVDAKPLNRRSND